MISTLIADSQFEFIHSAMRHFDPDPFARVSSQPFARNSKVLRGRAHAERPSFEERSDV